MVGRIRQLAVILLCVATVLLPLTAVAESSAEEDPVWLGVLIDDESLDGGILLMAIIPGGPADGGGLQRGDVLLEADGRGLAQTEDLENVLNLSRPGDQVRLRFLRGRETEDRQVTLARRPSGTRTWTYLSSDSSDERIPVSALPVLSRPAAGAVAYGFAVADVTPDLRAYFGAPKEAGVLVTEVNPGRAADRAGLRVGDVLVRLGSVEVHQAVEVDDLLPVGSAEQETVEAWVVRGNRPTVARLSVPEVRALPAAPAALAARTKDFETLERMIQSEIDRLNRRLRELHDRLEQLHETREASPDR